MACDESPAPCWTKPASPDEFATALRSLTRPGVGRLDDSELLSRFGQMLGHAGCGKDHEDLPKRSISPA
jgi:hypothetical protein